MNGANLFESGTIIENCEAHEGMMLISGFDILRFENMEI
jgi:hypothetical protein